MNQKIEISTWSIVKLFLVIIAVLALWVVRDVLIMLFVVLILVSALEPLAGKIAKYKIPRFLTVSVLYLALAALISLILYLIIPPLVDQIGVLAQNLPYYIDKFNLFYQGFSTTAYNWQKILEDVTSQLGNISQSFYTVTLSVFGGVASAVTVFVLSFYLILESKSAKDFVTTLIPVSWRESSLEIARKIGIKIGGWLRGQVILSFTVGLLNFIVLSIIGVPYALTLGVLAAVLEIVPIVGPVLAGGVAILVALATTSWLQALIVLILYILVQQLEANILVPKIMGKSVGLSPVVIIIALLVGGKLAGLPGAILAIPAAAAISVVFSEYQKMKKAS